MEKPSAHQKAQLVYFSHGGGPLPILGDPGHQAMVDFMQDLPSHITRPDRVLVISAHWEENTPTVLGAPNPPLFYDYYGFPEQAYEVTYPAQGDPELAESDLSRLWKQMICLPGSTLIAALTTVSLSQ